MSQRKNNVKQNISKEREKKCIKIERQFVDRNMLNNERERSRGSGEEEKLEGGEVVVFERQRVRWGDVCKRV